MKYKIHKDVYNKCLSFAEKRTGGSAKLYKVRGEGSVKKVFSDCLNGALGEWAVYEYLTKHKYECSKPDMKIYKRGEKSFDADLSSGKVKIHVKSQCPTSVKRYGYSWLIQRTDKLYADPSEWDLFYFTNVDTKNMEVEVLGCCWVTDISNDELWGECKVPSYRKTKIALYLEDFEDLLFQY